MRDCRADGWVRYFRTQQSKIAVMAAAPQQEALWHSCACAGACASRARVTGASVFKNLRTVGCT
eukprot:COSAG02_NODE_179_length_31090_cov_49.813785_15_plen_64_part_00